MSRNRNNDVAVLDTIYVTASDFNTPSFNYSDKDIERKLKRLDYNLKMNSSIPKKKNHMTFCYFDF